MKRKLPRLNEKQQYGIIAVLIIIMLGSVMAFSTTDYIISGYDGITAELIDVESNNTPAIHTTIDMTHVTALVHQGDYGTWIAPKTATGVYFEMDGHPDVHGSKLIDRIEERVPIDDRYETLKTWDVYIVNCSMGVTIQTSGGGMDPALDITYTIALEENFFSIFTQYSNNYAFIMDIYTRSAPSITSNELVSVSPASGGFHFPMTSLKTSVIPQWFRDSGYNVDALSKLERVSFDIKVNSIQPGSWVYMFRSDVTAIYDIGIDVFLVGYWARTVERGWDPPEDSPPWWEAIFTALGGLVDALGLDFNWIITVVILVVVCLVALKFIAIASAARRAGGRR